jgi:hypothetical protein
MAMIYTETRGLYFWVNLAEMTVVRVDVGVLCRG